LHNDRVTPTISQRARPLLAALLAIVGAAALATVAAAEGPRISGCKLGIGGQFRLGAWAPLVVTVKGGDEPIAARIVAVTADPDGLGVATSPAGGRPTAIEAGGVTRERLHVRPGRDFAPIEVQLHANGRVIDRRLFEVGSGDAVALANGIELPMATAADAPLLLSLGPYVGLATALEERLRQNPAHGGAVAAIQSLDDLPTDPLAYDGVTAALLVIGREGGRGWLAGLPPDDPRARALVEWVESGGRLVIAGGAGAVDALGPGGPFESLAPGVVVGVGSLARTTSLEQYASSEEPIYLSGGTLPIAKLAAPSGRVEQSDGSGEGASPLVVRTLHGFGEVTLCTIDLDGPALARWAGRDALLRELMAPTLASVGAEPAGTNGYYFREDLLASLLTELDNSFAGVTTAPLGLIVALILGYLALIGPIDYWFTHKVLGRPEATWVTFPLVVVATSVGAYAAGYWLKGDSIRINRLEVVDVIAATGATRGALLSHVFSPRAERYDASCSPRDAAGQPVADARGVTSWLGEPGRGVGGMSRRLVAAPTSIDYLLEGATRAASDDKPVRGMPIPVWSTKSLLSKWSGRGGAGVESSLTASDDGLVEGTLTNTSGRDWDNCQLVYGDWAWRLKAIGAGRSVAVGQGVAPIRVSTLLTPSGEGANSELVAADRSIRSLAPLLTLSAKLGPDSPTARNRCLPRLDLSHAVDAGKALLMVEVPSGEPSSLVVTPRTGDASVDRSWLFCRYVLDVQPPPSPADSPAGRP
jgi:hypothetical protein